MRLVVSGMDTASQKFVQLWGMQVSGFKPERHCIYCLKGKKEPRLNRDIGKLDIELPTESPYFYLFAMGRVPKHETNVHLAVRPQPGSVASVGSVYGVTFTIYDAFAPRIDRLPKGWMGLGDDYTSCRNFQFGVQMFGYHPTSGATHPGNHSLLPMTAVKGEEQQA